jgi:hypothetical protein
MTKWGKLRYLSFIDLGMILSSLIWLPLIDLLLKLFGYRRVLHFIENATPVHIEPSISVEVRRQAKSIARMVAIAARHGFHRATCLRKSLLVLWFLRRHGMVGQIWFGVRLVNGTWEAHAWVEWKGIIINDEADVRERFKPLENGFPDITAGL